MRFKEHSEAETNKPVSSVGINKHDVPVRLPLNVLTK